jgi:hypothetical protein
VKSQTPRQQGLLDDRSVQLVGDCAFTIPSRVTGRVPRRRPRSPPSGLADPHHRRWVAAPSWPC